MTGWECPRCHRTFAPEVKQCTSCPYSSDSNDLFTFLRKDVLVEWDTGVYYRISGLSGGGGSRTWNIKQVHEGKGIINGDGRLLGNTNLPCYCHPCADRRKKGMTNVP